MPKFKKTILPIGRFLVTKPDGSRTLKEFTEDFLNMVATNSAEMIKKGLRIPIPFRHAKEAVPLSVDEIPQSNSFDNAGYWDSVFMETIDGVPTLCGIADVEGSLEDLESPAGKLKHRVKEVSACIVDAWKDGLNRDWGPSMLHGAAVINPVVPGQKEFSLLSFPDNTYVLSASGVLDQSPTADSIAQLSKALEDSVGVYLPPGTMGDDLIKVLLVSLKQHKMTSDQSIEDQEIVDTQSIFMSLPEGKKMPLTKKQAEELVTLGAINPKNNKPFTLDDFDVDDSPSPHELYAMALTGELTNERKSTLTRRVESLVATGRTTKEYAEKTLYPEIDKYELSLGDGAKFTPNTIDRLVESLESLPVTQTPSESLLSVLPDGTQVKDGLPDGDDPNVSKLTKEEAEGLKKVMLSAMAG